MSDGSTGAPAGAMSLRQAGVVFDEIARAAAAVQRIGILMVEAQPANGGDQRDLDAFCTVVDVLSGTIGLLADFGALRCGGMAHNGGSLAEWLLPPVFDDSGEQQ